MNDTQKPRREQKADRPRRDAKARGSGATKRSRADSQPLPEKTRKLDLGPWARQAGHLRSLMGNAMMVVGMLVLVIVLLVVGIRELSQDNLVVESIRIPKALSEMGYTPEIVTERLTRAVLAMVVEGEEVAPQEQQDQVGSYHGLDRLTPLFQETDIPIPAVDMSLMSLVRFAKDFLRLPQRVVRGEIIQAPEGLKLSLRFTSSGRSAVAHSGDVESLLEGGAKELIEITHPYELADYHYWRGDWEKAVQYIRHCLDRPDEDDPWALTLWGRMLQRQGKADDAIERYRFAIARDRNFAPAYNEWGKALHQRGDYDGAIEKYGEAVKIDNRYDRAHLNWGIALEKQMYPARAMEKYQEAAEVNPKYKWARNNWGYILYLLGDDSGAMEQYREALAIDPKLTHSLGNWRISLQRYVDHEEGIGQFKTAAEVAGTHYATNELGRLLLNLERYDDAHRRLSPDRGRRLELQVRLSQLGLGPLQEGRLSRCYRPLSESSLH